VTEARLPSEPRATAAKPLQTFASGKTTLKPPRVPAVTVFRRPSAVSLTRSPALKFRPDGHGIDPDDLQARSPCWLGGRSDAGIGRQRHRREGDNDRE
jgi:hypothetical protein